VAENEKADFKVWLKISFKQNHKSMKVEISGE